ncbi:lipid droplet phospholipase 1-like isoform X2 [Nymphaea colorata]|nr:lipid droplet phospholipase 1-like isoform X2 [Nymphaea colorata]
MPEDSGNGVRSSAVANGGGTTVWRPSASAAPDHLVVMVNGILGSVTDWKFGAEQFARMLPDKVVVHCSERNVSTLTLDGIDVMGERLAEEVEEVITQMPGVRKISFVAHSLGGLVARYAIGRLYRPPSSEKGSHEGTICGLEAMNFITVATPHLGSRGYKQVPFLFGVAVFERAACQMSHWIFGRTGRHLFLTDCEGEPPLLQRMVADCGDLHFMSALRAFRRRVAYANVNYDHIVGWRTASIRCNHELPKEHWEDSLNEKYPHIVHEEVVGGCTERYEPSSCINDEFDMLEDRLAYGLLRVPWERVDVSFHTSKWRFVAHSLIQVKIPSVHSEGVDCIMHIIDNFIC